MINHLRTLLLNRDGSSSPPPPYPGEEYVPPAYRARALPGPLARIHALLRLDVSLPRAEVNWNLRCLLGPVHASELAEFMTAPDPRVTYLPFANDLFRGLAAGTVVRPTITVPGIMTRLDAGLDGDKAAVLFGDTEPYRTFRNLWERHDQLPYRLGGVTLALAYRLNELTG